jgi:site-specific DNA-methyltransferase (adenine-specific)
MSTDLIVRQVDQARSLLAQARDAGQAKQVADMAKAAEIYFKRQKLSLEAIQHATAIKIDAMTLMGAYLLDAPKNTGAKGIGTSAVPQGNRTPLIADLGISKRESSESQALARLAEKHPREHDKVRAGEISVQRAVAAIRKRQDEKKRKAAEKAALEIAAASVEQWRVDCADCLAWLPTLPPDSIDLILGSPPYEDARLYLENGEDQGIARSTEEWVAWMIRVYQAALRCCKGLVAFVVDSPTKNYSWSAAPFLLGAALTKAGIILRHPPIYQRVGIPGSGGPDWLRNDYEFIVCATRGGRLPWSDPLAMGQPCRHDPGGQVSHRTKDGSRVNGEVGYASMEERGNVGPHRGRQRAGRKYEPPEIANPGNVITGWATRGHADGDTGSARDYIPPEIANPGNVIHCTVGGGNMGDKMCHENEAPFAEYLAEFFIRSFCPRGGVVCDPFCGSGTTGKKALEYGRRFLGCDIRPSQVGLSQRRLAGAQQHLPLEV